MPSSKRSDDAPPVDASILEQLARCRRKVRALQEVGTAIASTLEHDELLHLVMERVSEVVDAERSTLYLLDPERGELWSKVAQGASVEEIRLRIGEGIAGWVARAERPLCIEDAYQDVRFDAEWDRRMGYRTRSIVAVPLRGRDESVLGVVQCLNKRTGQGVFDADDVTLLETLAAQASVAIENARLFGSLVRQNLELKRTKHQLERKVRELDVLFEIARVSASAGELDDLLRGVLARAMRAVGAEAASILLGSARGGELRFRAAEGGNAEAVRRLSIPLGEGICGWVAQHGCAQVVNDVTRDPRHSVRLSERVGYHPRSVLCVPLRWQGGVGALELLNKDRGQGKFTEEDLRLATVVAGHVSVAIDLAFARERREREARLSSLGRFLSGVLHDLRTPLSIIRGYVQLMEEEENGEARGRFARSVERQVDLLNTMVRETLAFARGERTLWIRELLLVPYFEELAEQLRRDVEVRGTPVRVELELRDRGKAAFDPAKLHRAVHNLYRNAVEAFGERGGTFQIVVDRDAEGALLLRFEDDGPGIPEQLRGRLFESFTTHGKRSGMGLGLALVRKVVEDHGGGIELRSEPGRTVFVVRLPQPPEPPERVTVSGEWRLPGGERPSALPI